MASDQPGRYVSPDPAHPTQRVFPRVPAYAWSWLQRSRPVLNEAAARLTGGVPQPGFVDSLREDFETDPFTRDVLIGVIADVAFSGRLPRFRPAGASWDRGLTWWAAAIAGTSPEEFERRTAVDGRQARLFSSEDESHTGGSGGATGARAAAAGLSRRRAASAERAMLVRGLRDLLRNADGDTIPVAGIRQLLAALDEDDIGERGQ